MPARGKPKTNVPAMRGGRSVGPKNAPAPQIPRPKINKHGSPPKQQGTKPKPEMYPQQLNRLKEKPGMPQYKDEIPSSSLRAVISSLKNF